MKLARVRVESAKMKSLHKDTGISHIYCILIDIKTLKKKNYVRNKFIHFKKFIVKNSITLRNERQVVHHLIKSNIAQILIAL